LQALVRQIQKQGWKRNWQNRRFVLRPFRKRRTLGQRLDHRDPQRPNVSGWRGDARGAFRRIVHAAIGRRVNSLAGGTEPVARNLQLISDAKDIGRPDAAVHEVAAVDVVQRIQN
jgi:hypothetical protein